MEPDTPDQLKLIREGDPRAFEQVFRTYYVGLCRFAYGFLGNTEDAEETVQDTFFKFWSKRQEIDVALSLRSYLYGAVKNACLNRIKHLKVRGEYHKHVQEGESVSDFSSTSLEATELQLLIDGAVNELPPERRKIFLMSRNLGLKYQEIADQLGLSVKTVEAQMGKALKYLRQALREYLPIVFVPILWWLELWGNK